MAGAGHRSRPLQWHASRSKAGESRSSNGMVPGAATRDDLDVHGGVNVEAERQRRVE